MQKFSSYALVGLALASLCSDSQAQKVWVVDALGGPGSDFTDVDPAVDAASDGDTLLLRNGFYSDLVISGKGLSVIADFGATPTVFGVVVRNLGPAQYALVSGLTISSPFDVGLRVNQNMGGVWIEDCQIEGAYGEGLVAHPNFDPHGKPGGVISDSALVTFINCDVTGGTGDSGLYWPDHWFGGGASALEFRDVDSGVVQGCRLTGGHGGSVDSDDESSSGGSGGSGVLALSSAVSVLDCDLFGGNGGNGGTDFDWLFGTTCGNGGSSGAGVWADGVGTFAPSFRLANLDFTPGLGGGPGCCDNCVAGAVSDVVGGYSPQFVWLGVADTELRLQSPVRVGTSFDLWVGAPAGMIGFVLVGGAPVGQALAGIEGLLLVDPAGSYLHGVGATPVLISVPVGLSLPAGMSLRLLTQLLAYDPIGGVLHLGDVASLTLLGQAL